MVALTYDDGPDPLWSELLLAQLRASGARATFFPITPRAVDNRGLVERMLADGHEVGFHCYRHVQHAEQSEAELTSDLATGLRQLASVGVGPRAWRAPWGRETEVTRRLAGRHGLRLWGWNLDSHDWRGDSAGEMYAAMLAQGGLRDGDVVLMHDGLGPGAKRNDCAPDDRADPAADRRGRARGAGAGTAFGVRRSAGVSSGLDLIADAAPRAPLDQALAAIAAGARDLDREPRFPSEAFAALRRAGALEATVGSARAEEPVLAEWALLRQVAAADASVGRILDGHLNAVERLEVGAEPELRDRELEGVRGGQASARRLGCRSRPRRGRAGAAAWRRRRRTRPAWGEDLLLGRRRRRRRAGDGRQRRRPAAAAGAGRLRRGRGRSGLVPGRRAARLREPPGPLRRRAGDRPARRARRAGPGALVLTRRDANRGQLDRDGRCRRRRRPGRACEGAARGPPGAARGRPDRGAARDRRGVARREEPRRPIARGRAEADRDRDAGGDRPRRESAARRPRPPPAARTRSSPPAGSIAPGAIWRPSSCSIASIHCWPASAPRY